MHERSQHPGECQGPLERSHSTRERQRDGAKPAHGRAPSARSEASTLESTRNRERSQRCRSVATLLSTAIAEESAIETERSQVPGENHLARAQPVTLSAPCAVSAANKPESTTGSERSHAARVCHGHGA